MEVIPVALVKAASSQRRNGTKTSGSVASIGEAAGTVKSLALPSPGSAAA